MIREKILIIIPAYNEGENIKNVVDNLINNYSQYDYIIVNDGSSDNTRQFCMEQKYNFIDLPINIGLAGAIKAGMRYAERTGYNYVIQLDGDGQHLPEYIEDMYLTMKENDSDIVIGSRFKSQKKPLNMRMVGSQLITLAIYITTKGKYIGDVTSGMRLFNKSMIGKFGHGMHYTPEPDTLAYLVNCGAKITEVQVEMKERIAGESYLNFGSSIRYMLHMLFSILLFQWVKIKER